MKDNDLFSTEGHFPRGGFSDEEAEPTVRSLQFAPIVGDPAPTSSAGSIDLLKDVPLIVTAELGRSKMLVKDILKLGVGSVIELDKVAGEPVDILVNGKIIARGEVVAIDENFGVRITEVLS